MTIAAVASGARGAAIDVWTLYAAAIVTAFGIAIMQPGMPTLVRQWLPDRIAVGTIGYTSRHADGRDISPFLQSPTSCRRSAAPGGSIVLWAVPASHRAGVFCSVRKSDDHALRETAIGGRWWPDWKNPLIWLLGFTFGSNNSPYFVTNAFLGDYLPAGQGGAARLPRWAGSTARRSLRPCRAARDRQ